MIELDFICTHCVHRNVEEFTCPAFPDGIPLEPLRKPLLHDEVLPNQVGTTVYEGDGTLQAELMYEHLKTMAARDT